MAPFANAPKIYALERQPDGKLLVAGELTMLNGVPVNSVCRLLPNGQVDASFNAPSLSIGVVYCLALQADGKVLIGGAFTSVGGQPRFGLARLLPDGALDTSFVPPFGRTAVFTSSVRRIIPQPGVGIISIGTLAVTGNGGGSFHGGRLSEATGAWDAAFATNTSITAISAITDALVLPNGHLVLTGDIRRINGQWCRLWGALPDGTPDPAFVPLTGTAHPEGLVRDSITGNIYVTRAITGTGLDDEPVRLLPNGVRDTTFNTAGTFIPGAPTIDTRLGYISSLAVQPNGRLLLGGLFNTVASGYLGSVRLLPSGAPDPSYQASNGPKGNNGVRKVLVQPDGALVFAGDFDQAGGVALNCLARMLDPNVLGTHASARPGADVQAWPMPAREVLHLRLPAGRPAQVVALLDALGRVVLNREVPAGQSQATLPTAGLLPGTYLLRVSFADGPPAYRRVAME